MPRKILDTSIVGKKFGRLTVLKPGRLYVSPKGVKMTLWACKCDCGTEKDFFRSSLVSGNSTSCGCYNKEIITKHGQWGHPLFGILEGMIQRCHNPNLLSYPNYGGRGIKVCDEWRKDPVKFFEYVGPRPSKKHSIDRIDNNGNYEPGNVRWADAETQINNTSVVKLVTVGYKTLSLSGWGRFLGIAPANLMARKKRGIEYERSILYYSNKNKIPIPGAQPYIPESGGPRYEFKITRCRKKGGFKITWRQNGMRFESAERYAFKKDAEAALKVEEEKPSKEQAK